MNTQMNTPQRSSHRRGWMIPILGFLVFAISLLARTGVVRGESDEAISKLTAISGGGGGLAKVSPTSQDQGTFAAEIVVNLHDTQANTTFNILRRPDFTPDGNCTGLAYLPFGVSLTTSEAGAGAKHFHFERSAPLISGVHFDVMFQVESADGATVLRSECMSVTVK